MPSYKIVGIERRQSNLSPITTALLNGQTVLLPPGSAVAGYYQTLKRRGYKIHQHSASDGLVIWAEKEETDGS